MFAAVDLGSNSFRLHVGQHDGNAMRIVKSARDPIRLGAGLDENGCLTEKAMRISVESLEGFARILGNYSLDAVRVVATNTLRISKNSAQCLAIGLPMIIHSPIPGQEERNADFMLEQGVAAQGERCRNA